MNKILIFFLLMSSALVSANPSDELRGNFENIFNADGSAKIGRINNLNTLSSKEDENLKLFLLDDGIEPETVQEGNYWYLSCQSTMSDKNLKGVTCGATRGELLILLTASGWLIQMESKPSPSGVYYVAFDKDSSFDSTYRILEPNKVRYFLKGVLSSTKMQYSTQDKNKNYIRHEISLENAALALSLLKDMREYY